MPNGTFKITDAAQQLNVSERSVKRAKDATKLYEAIEAKLGAQRKFVLWWDQQEKRTGTGLPSQSTDGRAAQDYGLDRDTIHRWRKRLKDPRKFDAALEKAQERRVKVCEARQGHSDHVKATELWRRRTA